MSIPGAANPLLLASAASTQYTVSRSLRFNSSDSAYLQRNFSAGGNRKTWTWSAWIKFSVVSSQLSIWSAGSTGTNRSNILIQGANQLRFFNYASTVNVDLVTTPVYRDPSAWYHIVLAVDTTQATSSDRVKLYINGIQVTAFSTATYPSPSQDLVINDAISHSLGRAEATSPAEYFAGYLADVIFIDGQALTPSSFTETSATTGQLIPKKYTGTFGTNGFWLQFADNSSNTATTLGKDTSGNNNNWDCFNLQTTTGGPTSVAAASGALPIYNTTDTYGATKGSGTRTDSNSSSIVLAIPMDGANNGTTFTDESATIKGSGSAKTISRFGDTKTSTAQSKYYGSSAYFDGTGDYLTASASADFNFGSGNFTIECWLYTSNTSTCDVFGYYSGTGFAFIVGNPYGLSAQAGSITIFDDKAGGDYLNAPAGSVKANEWTHIAVVRNGSDLRIFANGISVASKTTSASSFGEGSQDLGIGRMTGSLSRNVTGYISDFRVYKGVAKYTGNFNPPNSTQNATVAAGNDSLVDTPSSAGTDSGLGGQVTGNYATWNPLEKSANATLSNGNLDIAQSSGDQNTGATFAVSSGKWYWEVTFASGTESRIGAIKQQFVKTDSPFSTFLGGGSNGYSYANGGYKSNANSNSASGYSTYTTNDVISVALDLDNGRIFFAKNGTWQESGNPSTGANPAYSGLSGTFTPAIYTPNATLNANFGQRPFAYTAPSGYKALCDTNLPAPVVAKPSEVMDVKLYTGNGSTQNITGLGFSPDLVWIKSRSTGTLWHEVFDAIRGANNRLFTNATNAETTNNTLSSFNSNGFTLSITDSNGYGVNLNNDSYVAWAWDAGTTTTTNTQGSITSSVRTNGYLSIVTYSGNSTAGATVGHGLNVAPSLIIVKSRTATAGYLNWGVYHASLGNTKVLYLNTTGAESADSNEWNNTSPTSTVFSLGFTTGNGHNVSGQNYVAYCFAPVSGYSSFGSYVANANSDGPFVYTGFKPRFVLCKLSSAAGADWLIFDTARSPYNVVQANLRPNTSGAEESAFARIDILSNGFKVRAGSGVEPNSTNGNTYIYAAWAELPYQYSRAA